jgi:hypothetical protein
MAKIVLGQRLPQSDALRTERMGDERGAKDQHDLA